ncbi:MAG TPA: hypothetical protein VFN65_09070, partial [Solirubrobacteraceae bacterium]|nr:hypothetical protein [Solirubrobacteraceae bacterium]
HETYIARVLLLLVSIAAPLLVMAAVFLSCRTGASPAGSLPPRAPSPLSAESRWEGLSAEVAQLERRRATHRTDAATRRRHLARVLPADARG